MSRRAESDVAAPGDLLIEIVYLLSYELSLAERMPLFVMLVEEHIAPAELAQEFANVIQLRIAGLPGR